MPDIDLSLLELPALTLHHAGAAQGIEDTADAVPTGLDAGDATAPLLEILGAVCSDLDDLARLNRLVADQLTHVVTNFEGSDAQVAASFDRYELPDGGRSQR